LREKKEKWDIFLCLGIFSEFLTRIGFKFVFKASPEVTESFRQRTISAGTLRIRFEFISGRTVFRTIIPRYWSRLCSAVSWTSTLVGLFNNDNFHDSRTKKSRSFYKKKTFFFLWKWFSFLTRFSWICWCGS